MTKLETLFDNWWSIQFGGAARSGMTWRVASEAFEAGFKAARAAEPPADHRDVIKVWECNDCKTINFDITSVACRSCFRPRSSANRPGDSK